MIPVEFVGEGGVRAEACEDFEQAAEQGLPGGCRGSVVDRNIWSTWAWGILRFPLPHLPSSMKLG